MPGSTSELARTKPLAAYWYDTAGSFKITHSYCFSGSGGCLHWRLSRPWPPRIHWQCDHIGSDTAGNGLVVCQRFHCSGVLGPRRPSCVPLRNAGILEHKLVLECMSSVFSHLSTPAPVTCSQCVTLPALCTRAPFADNRHPRARRGIVPARRRRYALNISSRELYEHPRACVRHLRTVRQRAWLPHRREHARRRQDRN